jgi:hypothetical protein
VAELTLDQVQRHALARQLHRMRVAELVRREAAPQTRLDGEPPQLRTDRRGRPRGGRAWGRR